MEVTGPASARSLETNLLDYAASVIAQLSAGPPGPLARLVPAHLDALEVRFQRLSAKDGRQDALLCPRSPGGFLIVVDPELSPLDIAAGRDVEEAIDWRVAHELGHTFFFTGEPPRRWKRWTPHEETLADGFARLVLRQLRASAA